MRCSLRGCLAQDGLGLLQASPHARETALGVSRIVVGAISKLGAHGVEDGVAHPLFERGDLIGEVDKVAHPRTV